MVEKVLKQLGGAEKEASALREKILSAESELKIKGRVFYVSENGNDANDGLSPEAAFKTVSRVAELHLELDDSVLFERGSIFRLEDKLWLKPGVNYGAYGEGEKPKMYGSRRDYADPSIWKQTDNPNIWSIELKVKEARERAALTIFDNDEYIGVWKFTKDELQKDGDFYHDIENGIYYLYFEGGNPGEYFNNIEISTVCMAMRASYIKMVHIDNICFKYYTFGAMLLGECDNITVTNCEFGWLGGAIFNIRGERPLRYGNAMEFWFQCRDITVKNCWVYQVFDAAMTFQGSGEDQARFDNIKFDDNLIEYCSMNIEYWVGHNGKPKDAHIKDISYKGDIIRMSGYGWGGIYRWDKEDQALLLGWNRKYDDLSNFVIADCILDCADSYMIQMWGPQVQEGIILRDNSYYQKAVTGTHDCVEIVKGYANKASNQEELAEAIALFDKNPKLVKWLD